MGFLLQFFRYMRTFFKQYPKVVCFNCGKRFRLGCNGTSTKRYVIPNKYMIIILYFCKPDCHDQRIIDRSHKIPLDFFAYHID